MSGIIIFLAIFAAPVVFVYTQYNIRSFEIKEEYLNKRLVGHLLYEIQVSILQPCITECIHLGACESINFSRRNQTCELNDEGSETASPSEFVEEKGTVFSDVTNFHQIMAGVCSGHKCTDQQRCFPMGNHYVCKTIECGDLPLIPHGVFKQGGNVAGSIRKCSCPNGMNVNGTESITCLHNGTWSRFEGACTSECNVSVFNNADVRPFQNSSGSYSVVNCNAGYISNEITDTANEVTVETVTCGNDGKWIPNIDCIDSKNLYNIALKKPTTQSSTFKSYGSDRGTDGIWDPDSIVGKSCTFSDIVEDTAWWEVDLLQIYVIRRVKILNLTEDYFAERFRQVTATIGISPNPTDICGATYVGPAKSEEMVEFICTVTGRYVRLSKPNSSGSINLIVCEVGIYEN